ncbi:helix-turn-helix domain-containing protein [Micromonospora parva]|uniref:helix-turn-helix domain-containing protein n=1 Tax=Micromonospora parva TaxID=1464048 RepID=UPI0033E885C2
MAERFGVSRQAVHRWLGWYRDEGLDGLADRSHRPRAHPERTSPEVEAAICELRRGHPRRPPRRTTTATTPNATARRTTRQQPRRPRHRGQKIHVGIGHAGRTLTVEDTDTDTDTDTAFRVHDSDQLLTEVPRTTTKPIARFKVRKPEPPRQRRIACTDRDDHGARP